MDLEMFESGWTMKKTTPTPVIGEATTASAVELVVDGSRSSRLYSPPAGSLLGTHDLTRESPTALLPVEAAVLRALLERVVELVTIARAVRDRLESGSTPTSVPPADVLQRPLLTPADLADLLGISKQALYAMVERGQIPGVMRPGKRKLLFRTADLVPWFRGRATSANRSRP